MTIRELHNNQRAVVQEVGGEGSLRQHLLDMGIIPGVEIEFLGAAPMGDPIELQIQGYSLTLRLAEAELIAVELIEADSKTAPEGLSSDFGYNLSLHEHNAHPGIGESGKYHSKDHAHPLPKDAVLTIALAGQQNCGKTTLFNQLTGSNQHVGNFPGVTVDRKDGVIIGYPQTRLTDLPGIYSLSTYTAEELVSREFILREKPKALINIVDAGNIERNLYITVQLMELGVPMVLAVNMMDELRGNGGSIRVNEMERELGIPVVPISAAKNEGIDELVDHLIHIAKYQEAPARQDFCDKDDHGGAVHRCMHSIMHVVEDHAEKAGIPKRFAASRLIEGDADVASCLNLSDSDKSAIEQLIVTMEDERGLDRHAAMAEMRFSFINKLCANTVVKPRESKEHIRSRKIDKVLTGKWTALPVFVAILALIFWLTFDVIGAWLQDLLAIGISALGQAVSDAMEQWNVNQAVQSLVVDAIFGGVGSVVSFVPVIIVMFFFLSMLEDSGYMARVAFVSDKLLRKIGLSGRSIVPMLIGFGCSVPAVMASRTLPSARDRRKTIMLIPFMSCSAKIAIYGFLASAFFPGKTGLVMICLYLLGIVTGIVIALVGKWCGSKSEASPFVMELPVYRLPVASNVGHLLWDKTKDFLQRAFTVIFLATIVIWFFQSFNTHLAFVEDGSQSMLAAVAGWIAPVFQPMGLGDWRVVTALISGFLAKESVVATLEVLGATAILTAKTAIPLLVFCLLYTPCVAAVASIKRELGGKWACFLVVFQCTIAWVLAFVSYLLF